MEELALLTRLRSQIGDTDLLDPNITDEEMKRILEDSAAEYSRIKSYVKFLEIPYDKSISVYSLPLDSLKVKYVKLKPFNFNFVFIDNLDQVILENEVDVDAGVLQIAYIRYFAPSEIDSREIDIYFLYAEGLCYKLMASKTADLIKFNTGEKMIDESGLSAKYLELAHCSEAKFRKRAIKAYGRRMNNTKPDLNYDFPYPIEGEEI
jgi:hypothetical protein